MTIIRILTFCLIVVTLQGCGEQVSRVQIASDIAIAPQGDAFAITGSGFVIVFTEDQGDWNPITHQDLVYGVVSPTFNREGDKLFFSMGKIQELSDDFSKLNVLGDSRTLNENVVLAINEDGKFALDSKGPITVATGERMATANAERTGGLRFLSASADATWFIAQQGLDPDSELLVLLREKDGLAVSGRFRLSEKAGIKGASVYRDGSRFCVLTTQGAVYIWSSSELRKLTNWSGVEHSAFSANGQYLALAGGNGLQVWDIKSDAQVSSSSDGSFKRVAISADGSRVVALSLADEVHLFEMPDLTPVIKVSISDHISKP